MNDITDVVGIALMATSAAIILTSVARTIWNKIRPKSVFLIQIEPDEEDGGYVASCLSLPGCHSQGDTVEEAMTNIVDAIEAYMAALAAEQREKSLVDTRQSNAMTRYVGVRSSMRLA